MQKFIQKYATYFEPKAIKLIEKCFVISMIICLIGVLLFSFYHTYYISISLYEARLIIFRTGRRSINKRRNGSSPFLLLKPPFPQRDQQLVPFESSSCLYLHLVRGSAQALPTQSCNSLITKIISLFLIFVRTILCGPHESLSWWEIIFLVPLLIH